MSANGSKTFYVQDAAWNTWSCEIAVTNIDKTKPSVSATNSSTSWKSGNISITKYASDWESWISGAKYYWTWKASVTLAQCWNNGIAYTSGTTETRDIEWTWYLQLCAYDEAWNTAVWSGIYKLDKTAPEVWMSNSSTSWKSGDISIKLTASDATSWLSGNAKYYWTWKTTITMSQCWSKGTTYTSGTNITRSTEWTGYLYVCAYDKAWNSKVLSGTYKIDKTAPSCSISQSPVSWTWTNGNVTLTATVTETNPSKYSWTWTSNMVTNLTTWTMSANGSKTFYVQDAAWNTWSCEIAVTNIDKTAPIATLTWTATEKSFTQWLTWICTDDVWVSAYYFWTTSNPTISQYVSLSPSQTSFTTWMEITAAWDYYLFCKDESWNTWSANVIYHRYRWQNLLEKVSWNKDLYNTGNYASSFVQTDYFIILSGTTINLDSGWLYRDPLIGHDVYIWRSNSSSVNSLVKSNPKITYTPMVYRRWYTRDLHELTLLAGTGITAVNMTWTLSGYSRVEYVQTNGTNYIDTEYIPVEWDEWIFDLQSNYTLSSSDQMWLWQWTSGEVWTWLETYWTAWTWYVRYGSTLSSNVSSTAAQRTGRHKYGLKAGSFTIDWTQKLTPNWWTSFPQTTMTVGWREGTSFNGVSLKIYGIKVTNSGEVKLDMVPCRTSTWVYWMCDKVSQRFFAWIWEWDLIGWQVILWTWLYKHWASATISATVNAVSWYTFSGWLVDNGNTPANINAASTTVTITEDSTLTAVAKDAGKPSATLTWTNTEMSTSQRLTWTCTDEVWVVAYYFWTNANPTTYTQLSSQMISYTTWMSVSTAGTYYMICKDAAWNTWSTHIIYNWYKVQNLVDTVAWNQWTYNSWQYVKSGSIQPNSNYYIIQSWTTIKLDSGALYGDPIGWHDTYKWWSTQYNSTVASVSWVNPKVVSWTTLTYYRWYNRKSYNLDLIAGTGTSVIKLPAWYTRVEYVQSQWSGYIDTEYVLSNHSSVEVQAKVVANYDSGTQHLFWNYGPEGRRVTYNVRSAYDIVSYFGNARLSHQRLYVSNQIVTYKTNKEWLWVDDVLKKSWWNVWEFQTSGSFYLFTAKWTTNYTLSWTRIYWVKVEEAGELAFYWVPCRTSTWVYGIYDVVWDKFHPSAGTIDLTWWADMKEWSWSYKYGESAWILAKTNPWYTWSGWTVNSGNTPVDVTAMLTTVTITGYTKLTAVAEDITAPRLLFTGATPASGAWQNWNYFTKEIEIIEWNMAAFTWTLDNSGMRLYDDSLVLMYNFDNVARLGESSSLVRDLSKYGNDGTIPSTSNITHTSSWVRWWAYGLSWSTIDAWNDTSLRSTSNFTVSVWVKNEKTPDANTSFLSRWSSSNNQRVWWMFIRSGQQNIFFYISTWWSNMKTTSNVSLPIWQWHHVVMVHDWNDVLMYMDWIYKTKLSNVWSLYNAPTTDLLMWSSKFSGYLDEVRMYDRALTADEVSVLYRSNLSKISTNKWLYTINYTWVADWQHTYGWEVVDVVWQSTWISRTINIDTVVPVCTINVNPMWCTSGNVTLSWIVTEVNNSWYSWTWWSNMKSTLTTFVLTWNGNKTLYLEDRAWNTGSCSTWINNIDRSWPTWTINVSGWVLINGTKYFSWLSLTLLLSGLDSGCSTVEKMRFSCNGTSWSPFVNYASTTWFTIPTSSYGCNRNDGAKTIYVLFIDALWNTWIASTGFVLDRTSPTITVVPNTTGCTNTGVQHQISYNDTWAGINTGSLVVSSDNMTTWWWVSGTPLATGYPATWSLERNVTVYWKICDKVWNCSTAWWIPIKIDKTAPTVSVTNAIGNESTWITWGVSASDTSGYCGTLTYYWTWDIWSWNTTWSYGKMEDEPIVKTWYVRVTDAAGNSTVKAVKFTWKNTAPVSVNVTNNGSTWECRSITFAVTWVDTWATLKYQWYTWANCSSPINWATWQTYTYSLNKTWNYKVYVKVSDSQWSGTCSAVNTGIWTDETFSISSPYELGLITWATVINNLTWSNVFNVVLSESCETITIKTWTCTKATTMVLNGGNLTITPTPNTGWIWSCTVRFTDGDTRQTWTINFTVQTLEPTVTFTWTVASQINPSGSSCIKKNRYLTKMQISNTPELWDLVYVFKETINGSTNSKNYSVYDSGLVLMYNFDNVASLWETSTLVKDLSNNGNDGTIASATWTTDGVWWWAYNFVDWNINAWHGTWLTVTRNMTVSAWIKTNNTNTSAWNTYVVSRRDTTNNNNKRVWWLLIKKSTKTIQFLWSTTGGATNVSIDSDVNVVDKQWHHIVFTHDGSQIKLYVDGVLQWTGANTWLFSTNANLVIAQYISTKFNWQVDEVRMYNRALSQDEIQFLYKSNLSKINTWTWLFQTLNTCLAQSWTYAYSGIVTSRYGQLQTTWRKISTCIPSVVMTWWVNMNLWTGIAQNTSQVFTGQYTVEIRVEDWIGRNWWTWSVRISDNFSWQNKHFMFSSTWFRMKYDSIQDLWHYMTWIIPEYTTGVKLNDALSSFSNIVKYNENNQWTPYFVANYPEWDFMCNGWVYGDRPFMQLEVPAWVPVDTYRANVYFTIED